MIVEPVAVDKATATWHSLILRSLFLSGKSLAVRLKKKLFYFKKPERPQPSRLYSSLKVRPTPSVSTPSPIRNFISFQFKIFSLRVKVANAQIQKIRHLFYLNNIKPLLNLKSPLIFDVRYLKIDFYLIPYPQFLRKFLSIKKNVS